jgi:rhodanese-related sulfurtransferase
MNFKHCTLGMLSILLGGVFTFANPGWSIPIGVVTPDAIAPQLESDARPLLLDVRSEDEYREGHIPGAVNIPYHELPGRLDELAGAKTQAIVVYCEIGVRAGIAELVLDQAGFEQVSLLAGHMQAWRDAGLPVDTVSPAPSP